MADIEGQYEDAQADVSDYSEEVEEASAAEDLEELRHELQAASEKLNTIRVKMMVSLRTTMFTLIVGFQPF